MDNSLSQQWRMGLTVAQRFNAGFNEENETSPARDERSLANLPAREGWKRRISAVPFGAYQKLAFCSPSVKKLGYFFNSDRNIYEIGSIFFCQLRRRAE